MDDNFEAILREIVESNEAIKDLERKRGADPERHPHIPVVYVQGDLPLRDAIIRHQRALNAAKAALGLAPSPVVDPEAHFEE